MKQQLSIILLAGIVAFSCQQKKQETTESAPVDSVTTPPPAPVTLTLKWATDSSLTTNESVIYDKDKDVLYVSNINGTPDGKDGNGFISKVSLDGKVTELKWAKGMDAPKGLGLANGKLYVTDIDRVHEIDPASGKVTKTHKIKGAKFLNDIATDETGKVYISDTGAGVISILEKGKITTFLDSIQGGPNGLLVDGNQLLMLTFEGKTLSSIDPSTKQITVKAEGIDNGDGIEAVGDGGYLVSSWNGMIHYISPEWKKTLVLDTRADSLTSADIEYIQEKNLLLVPTFFKNKVMAYELTK